VCDRHREVLGVSGDEPDQPRVVHTVLGTHKLRHLRLDHHGVTPSCSLYHIRISRSIINIRVNHGFI